jgi:hypothetical protein
VSVVVEHAALERHTLTLPDGLVARALHEVLALGDREGSFSSGRVESGHQLPPAAAELDAILRAELIDPLGRRTDLAFHLAFLKAGDGDAPADQMFAPRSMAGTLRVFRVIVNLSEYSRRVLLWGGDSEGPPDELLIPGRRSGAVHALHYRAGAVPHCGVNDAIGYFVASYEAPL